MAKQMDLFDAPRGARESPKAVQSRAGDHVAKIQWTRIVQGLLRARGWYRIAGRGKASYDIDVINPQRNRGWFVQGRAANDPMQAPVRLGGPFDTQRLAKDHAQLLVDSGEVVKRW